VAHTLHARDDKPERPKLGELSLDAMYNLEAGDIVDAWLSFDGVPGADDAGREGKTRPAIFIAKRGTLVLLRGITDGESSYAQRQGTTPIRDWREAGLKKPSVVMTYDQEVDIADVWVRRGPRRVTAELDHDAIRIEVVLRVTPTVVNVHDRLDTSCRERRLCLRLTGLVGGKRNVVHPHRQAVSRGHIGTPALLFSHIVQFEKGDALAVTRVEKQVTEVRLAARHALNLGVNKRKTEQVLVEVAGCLGVATGKSNVMETVRSCHFNSILSSHP
jgi:hypothetical protein